jgi:hypothetical protein
MAVRSKSGDNDVVIFKRSFFREKGAERWKGTTKKQKQEFASKGGKSAWSGMSLEERSAEMKRRAKVRAKNRKKAK